MEKVSGTLSNAPSVSNYESLHDKPQINGVTLSGNKENEELGLVSKTQFDEMKTKTEESIEEINDSLEELQQQSQELQKVIEELVDGNEVAY